MSQSVVSVRLNGHAYQMGCDEGQEQHIEMLGREVDAVLQQLIGSVGQIGEARLLAMACLILADLAHSSGQPMPSGGLDETQMEEFAMRLETAAKTINQLASSLPKA